MNPRRLIIAVVVIYVLMLFGGGALKPGYSHISQYISELNATGTAYAQLIGWLGFVPFAIFSAILIVIYSRIAPVKGASRVGYWLLMLQPVAYLVATVSPCDAGCPAEGSPSQMLHNTASLLTYVLTGFGLFLLALTPKISLKVRALWFALGLVWLFLFALMADTSLAEWRGLFQRLAEWIVFGTLLVVAWRLGRSQNA